MPSKSFNFKRTLPYAIMQFSIAYCIFLCLPKIDYGMYTVLLQNTFQSSMPLLNAFFGLSVNYLLLTAYCFLQQVLGRKNNLFAVIWGVQLLRAIQLSAAKNPGSIAGR